LSDNLERVTWNIKAGSTAGYPNGNEPMFPNRCIL
jgi:hypothetical protein